MSLELIKLVLICALLGMGGQLIRVFIGLYKLVCDDVNKEKSLGELMNYKRLIFSVIFGFVLGGFSSLLFIRILTVTDILTVLAIGYSGTDWIEGLFTSTLAKIK